MIKNIVFDMGGVLIRWSPRMYIDRYNISEEDKQLLEKVIYKGYHWPLLDFGYYKTEQDFLNAINPMIPEHLREITKELVTKWDQPHVLDYPGMAELIERLKKNGYNIYLLSNAGPRHDEYWPKVAASKFFDGKVVSAYEKQFKPGAEIFNTLLNRFSLKAEECIFIDDMATNCAGAFLVGFTPIVFENPEQLEAELRKLNIKL